MRVIHQVANRAGDWILNMTAIPNRRRWCRMRRSSETPTTSRFSTRLLLFSVFAMQAHATISSEREIRFDTDSDYIGIDNRCSACISHDRSDFIGDLTPTNRVVKGFGGTRITNVQMGTIQWSWEDDRGVIFTFQIPNSYYVPDGKVRLLSPQHWAKSQHKGKIKRSHSMCGERTDATSCVLFWDNGSHQRTVLLGKRDNVATFTLAPGFHAFEVFCQEAELSTNDVIALPAGIISDDEDDDASVASATDPAAIENLWTAPTNDTDDVSIDAEPTPHTPSRPTHVDFNMTDNTPSEGEGRPSAVTSTTNVIIDEEDRQPGDLAELLKLHHQYGHISMRKLQ